MLKHEIFKSGVKPLDQALPEGIPRNSLIALMGEPSTGKSALLAEIAFRRLQNNEPILYIMLEDEPVSLIHRFQRFGFDIMKHINQNKLRILDGFSYRMSRKTQENKLCKTNQLILQKCKSAITPWWEIENTLGFIDQVENLMDQLRITEQGLVVLDSLTEFLTKVPVSVMLETLKNLKAIVAKERFATCITVLHVLELFPKFASAMTYISDGVIFMRFNPDLEKKGLLIKELMVRKMSGVQHGITWIPFHIEKNEGFQIFDKKKILQHVQKLTSFEINDKKETKKRKTTKKRSAR